MTSMSCSLSQCKLIVASRYVMPLTRRSQQIAQGDGPWSSAGRRRRDPHSEIKIRSSQLLAFAPGSLVDANSTPAPSKSANRADESLHGFGCLCASVPRLTAPIVRRYYRAARSSNNLSARWCPAGSSPPPLPQRRFWPAGATQPLTPHHNPNNTTTTYDHRFPSSTRRRGAPAIAALRAPNDNPNDRTTYRYSFPPTRRRGAPAKALRAPNDNPNDTTTLNNSFPSTSTRRRGAPAFGFKSPQRQPKRHNDIRYLMLFQHSPGPLSRAALLMMKQ